MGTGYTRNDTANNIADGNVINASDLDGEFDAIQSAFNGTTGHSHDGTTGEGPQIDTAGIANDAVTLGTKTSGNYVAAGAVSGVGLSGSASAEGATFTVTSNATDANTASTIVARDASGNFSAGTITATLSGNATTATTATTANSVAADSVALGTDTTGNYVAAGAVSGVGLSGSASAEGATFTVTSNATDANTASTIVARDASGNFSAGTITASLTGTASNADQLDSLDSTSFLRSDAADTKTAGDLSFADNVKAQFGASNDLQIYHDGSHSYIRDLGTGDIRIRGADINIQQADGNNQVASQSGGAVSLSYNGSTKLATTSGGIDVTGGVTFDGGTTSADLNFDDNAKAVFGGSSDLKIYHDGLNSYIQDSGTGDLKIYATNYGVYNATGSAVYMTATNGGAVDLRYNNLSKLTTSSVGITVSGDVIGPASADFDIKTGSGTGDMLFHTNFGEVMRVGADGRVGIGQTATTDKLEVNGDVRAVDFNATSDERLKSNIRKIEGALDKVCQMNGMHYVLDGKEASGVIAQNVQTVAPEVVADEGEYMTVAYNQLIGYLIEAVKELKTEVEELKNGNTPSVS